MKLKYVTSGIGALFLTGVIVVGCGDSGSDDDGEGGKGGSDSSGGKGGNAGGKGGASATGGKGGASGGSGGKGGTGGGGTGGATGGTGGATGGSGGATGGSGGSAGAAGGAAGGSAGAGVDAAVAIDAPVNVPDAGAADTNEDAGPVVAGLLVHEPFGAIGRLSGAATGAGWGAPWAVNSDDATMPGYEVKSATPLSYMNLRSTTAYATGGQVYRESGRALDVSPEGVLKDFLSAPGVVGAAGKSLWISFLMRRDTTSDTTTKASFHSSGTAFWDGDSNAPATFAFGYFGAGSKTGDTSYWSLRLREADAPVKTAVAITAGQTVFVVMKVSFSETGGTVSLYLNPASLGADAPATASAEVTATMPLTFKNIMFYPGNSAGSDAIDEIRFGTTYASVTPTL